MKIYIDQCHGCGQDRGANGYVNEEVCSDEMTAMVVAKLKALGHEVLATRPTGNLTVQQSLSWRCSNAGSWGADIFISNHNNAGGGEGAEVYTYEGNKLVEAQRYLQYILNHGGKTHDGTSDHNTIPGAIKNGSGLAVINGTRMEALLLENFYVDTQSDVNFYNGNKEMFANALVYGITGVDVENKPSKPPVEMHRNIIIYNNGCEPDKWCAEYFAMILNNVNEDCVVVDYQTYRKSEIEGKSIFAVGGSLLNKFKYHRIFVGKDRNETAESMRVYLEKY